MNRLISVRVYSFLFVILMALSGCGGGGGGSDSVDDSPDSNDSNPTTQTTINVSYVKGPVDGATAILLDADGNTVAGPVTTVAGQAAFTSVTFSGMVYARFNGGSYTDEATGTLVNLPSSFSIRSGVINNTGTGTLQLTASPLTEIGFQRAENAGGGVASLSVVNNYVTEVADEYGLDGINLSTTVPTPLQNVTGSSDEDLYGVALAAITQQSLNSGNTTPTAQTLDSYISSNESGVDTTLFSAAISDLETNTNTSSFVDASIVNTLSSSVGVVSNYNVGGTVSGLNGIIELSNNGSNTVQLSSDGPFTFSNSLADGSTYLVSVSSAPAGQTCSISNGSGIINGANVNGISVSCSTTSGSTLTYTLGGTVTGLNGDLELLNNGGDSLLISSDGSFAFANSISNGDSYQVTVSSAPVTQICSVTDGSGNITGADVTNVNVSCSDAVGVSYSFRMKDYGIAYEEPSIVTSAFRVLDTVTGLPVSGLTVDDFQVTENGSIVDPVESYTDLETVESIPYTFYTVLALDISTSIDQTEMIQLKDAARALVVDPATGDSKLLPNQLIAIYTFAGTVAQVAEFTSDTTTLLSAIDSLPDITTSSSTSLNEAIVKGMDDWDNTFTIDNVTYGAMVVITDGDDTAGVNTTDDAFNAVGNKELYAIPVGTTVNQATLESVAGSDYVIEASDFTDLEVAFNNVREELANFADGLYFLHYASPRRNGSWGIEVSLKENINTDANSTVSDVFSAEGFTDVLPQLKLILSKPLLEPGDNATLTVKRLWTPASYSEPDFEWYIGAAQEGSFTYHQLDASTVELALGDDPITHFDISVTDLSANFGLTKTVTAATGGLAVKSSTGPQNYTFSDQVLFNHNAVNGYGYQIENLYDNTITSLPYNIPNDLNEILNSEYITMSAHSGLGDDEYQFEIIDDWFLTGDVSWDGSFDLRLQSGLDAQTWLRTSIETVVRVTNITRGVSKDVTLSWILLPSTLCVSGSSGQCTDNTDTVISTLTSTEPRVYDYSFMGFNQEFDIAVDYTYDDYNSSISRVRLLSGGNECELDLGFKRYTGYAGTMRMGPFSYAQRCIWNLDIRTGSYTPIYTQHRVTVEVDNASF